MNHIRNYERTQFADIRKKIDPHINEINDELEVAYYNHWKLGLPYNFYGYNVLSSVEESKAQFDRIHGLLFSLHEELLREINKALPNKERYLPLEYEYAVDLFGVKLFRTVTPELEKLKEHKELSLMLKNTLNTKLKDQVATDALQVIQL